MIQRILQEEKNIGTGDELLDEVIDVNPWSNHDTSVVYETVKFKIDDTRVIAKPKKKAAIGVSGFK